ncbi:MAG: hypothetical protein IJ538_02190 [Clostridia bacterium]|nr:hypothetical protein [Clostridia bacterium]
MEELVEQPENISNQNSAQNELESNNGSTFGKFKNVKNLLDAYTNLEAEFTRKSQKLAEIEKEFNENALFNKEENIDDFLKRTNSEDKKEEILQIVNNELFQNLPNKFDIGLAVINQANERSANILNDSKFIDEYLSNNEALKTKIIAEYLSKINNIPQTPKLISGNSTNVYIVESEKPKTIKEAGEIFSKMLK